MTLKPILEGEKQYLVPLYQRTYAWQRKQLERLWTDILAQADALRDGTTAPVTSSAHSSSPRHRHDRRGRAALARRRRAAAADHPHARAGRTARPHPDWTTRDADRIHRQWLVNEYQSGDDHSSCCRPRPTVRPSWRASPRSTSRPVAMSRPLTATSSSSSPPSTTPSDPQDRAASSRPSSAASTSSRSPPSRTTTSTASSSPQQHRDVAQPRRPAAQPPLHAAAHARRGRLPQGLGSDAGRCSVPRMSRRSPTGPGPTRAARTPAQRHLPRPSSSGSDPSPTTRPSVEAEIVELAREPGTCRPSSHRTRQGRRTDLRVAPACAGSQRGVPRRSTRS